MTQPHVFVAMANILKILGLAPANGRRSTHRAALAQSASQPVDAGSIFGASEIWRRGCRVDAMFSGPLVF